MRKASDGTVRKFTNLRLREVRVDLKAVDDAHPDATQGKRLFFFELLVVGLSTSLEDRSFTDFFQSSIYSVVAAESLNRMAGDPEGVFWRPHNAQIGYYR